jgi:hypothetical protein
MARTWPDAPPDREVRLVRVNEDGDGLLDLMDVAAEMLAAAGRDAAWVILTLEEEDDGE